MNGYQRDEEKGRTRYYNDFSRYYTITFTKAPYEYWDFTMTSRTESRREYLGDVKDVDRPYSKYSTTEDKGFLIDYNKLREVKKAALNTNRIPVITAYFTDKRITWNLSKANWESRAEWRLVNKDGQHYGEKEWEMVTYLYENEAEDVYEYN